MVHPTEVPTPLQDPWRQPRLRPFAANEPDIVGWSALVAAMVAAGVAAGLVAHALDLPVPVLCIAGAALVLGPVVAADRRQFRSLHTAYSRWTPPEASEVEALASRLRGLGYDVAYQPPGSVERGDGPGLLIRQRDWPAVRRLIDEPR